MLHAALYYDIHTRFDHLLCAIPGLFCWLEEPVDSPAERVPPLVQVQQGAR